jgi:hypothetical protein
MGWLAVKTCREAPVSETDSGRTAAAAPGARKGPSADPSAGAMARTQLPGPAVRTASRCIAASRLNVRVRARTARSYREPAMGSS